MGSIDFSFWVPLVLTVAAASAAAGFFAGLFGVGGGAIFVPVLYQTFNALGVDESVTMHLAIGSSLAIIIPTSIRSLDSHLRRGAVDTALLKEWALAVPVGAVLGAAVAASVSSEGLRGIFAVLAFLIAMKLVFGRLPFTLASDLPPLPGRLAAGLGIGVFSSLMGVGGGVLNNSFMTLYGRSMLQAIATSAGVGLLVSVPGILGYVVGGWDDAALPAFSIGYINLVAVLLIAPASLLTVPVGTALAHRLTRRQLELGFGMFLLIVSARFAYSLV